VAIAGGGGGLGRLLGLGFMFGAKDKGTTKVTKDIGTGFDQISESVDRVGKQTSGLLKFGAAIGTLNFLQLDRVGNALEGLAEKAGVGEAAQANELETWGIQFGKAYREATAGMGSMRKEVDKYKKAIGGVAFTLEIDAGEMTKGIALITKSGNALEDYGLTVRDVGGLTQAGILNSEQLANVMTSLSNSYGLGAKGAGKLVDEIAALGEQTGVGADAIRMMPEAIKAADAAMAALPENMTGNVQDMLKSLTILAASSQRVLGGPYEDAFQAATDVMQKMTESRLEMARTFTGLGGEFPELASRLAESYGSVDKAFEMMAADPATFIGEIQKVYASLDETRRFRLLEQLPESIKFMVKAGAEGAKVIEAMQKPIEGASGALGKMAKAASGSTRTFAESMDLLEQRFDNTLKTMARWDGKVNYDREVINRTRRVYDRWGERIKKLTEGPLGGLVKFFLRVRRYGFVNALATQIDMLSERTDKVGDFFKKIKDYVPFLDDFGDALVGVGKAAVVFAGLKLSGTLGVIKGIGSAIMGINPLVIALAAAGYLVYKNWDKIEPVLKEIGKGLEGKLVPAFEEVSETVTLLGNTFAEVVDEVWNDVLLPFLDWFTGDVPKGVHKGVYRILTMFVGLKFGIKASILTAVAVVKLFVKSIKLAGTIVKEGLGGSLDYILDRFEGFFSDMHVGWMKLTRMLKGAAVGILEIVGWLIEKIPEPMLEKIGLGGFNLKAWTVGSKELMTGLRADVDKLDKEIYELEEARRRSNAVAEAEGMERLKRLEGAAHEIENIGTEWGKGVEKAVEEGAAGLEWAEKVGRRAQQAMEGKVVEKEEKRKGRRGKRTVEAARAEAAMEAETFMVRGRRGESAIPLDYFMKAAGETALSTTGAKQMRASVAGGMMDAAKKMAKGARPSAQETGLEVP
jgi:hypothetical protein